MSEPKFSLGAYANQWIQNCHKNGLAVRSKVDVSRHVKDPRSFRQIVRRENLFLHECDSHSVLSTSEIMLAC